LGVGCSGDSFKMSIVSTQDDRIELPEHQPTTVDCPVKKDWIAIMIIEPGTGPILTSLGF